MDSLLVRLAASTRRRPPLHLIGTKRFELRRQLGSGTFGDVYEARDREHGTIVALKSLKSSHPDWIYRFKREFRIVGDLAHPNLVRLYELFLEDEHYYLTMELVDGLRFDEHVRRAPDQLRSCFGQLALGIVELHRSGCLHRDLKPSNALVEPTGRVVLLDFGLAVYQRASRTTAVAGTPPFMAPEVGLGQPPSAANDWYAFGVMLYDALAGRLPFAGDDITILQQKLGPPPPRPSELQPHVDPALDALAMGLIAKGPEDRPSADDVLRVLVGGHVSVGPLTRRSRRAPLAGRARELEQLRDALAGSATTPTVVTVRGAPGLGKTSLVTTFLESIRESAQVYQGRCLELESVPFKGLDGAVDSLCNDLRHRRYDEAAQLIPDEVAALAQMFPMVKRVDAFSRELRAKTRPRSPQELRQAAAAALRQLFGKLAERAPVVLFDDDLQWSSDDSVRLLVDLLRPPAPPLLLIIAYRDDGTAAPAAPVSRLLAELAEQGVRRVDVVVEPLDASGIGELLAAQPAVGVDAGDALRETGGHPYLLARLLERGARGERSDGPLELARVLAADLDQLDPDARRLLEAVSVAGAPISQRVAFAAAGLRIDPATLDQLRRRRLVHGTADDSDAYVEAYHDRVRDIALAGLADDRRRALHLAISAALETTGLAEPETLARHYREGNDRPRALHWTRIAARQATATLAFARAVELATEAVALAGDPLERIDLLEALAETHVQAGRRNDAGTTTLAAAQLAAQVEATRAASAPLSTETGSTLPAHHSVKLDDDVKTVDLRLAHRDTADVGGARVEPGREHRADDARAAALRARAGEHFLLGGQLERGLELLRDALAAVGVSLPESPAVAVAESFNLGGALATRGLAFRRRDVREIEPLVVQRVDLVLAVTRALLFVDLRAPLLATRALLDALDAGEPARVQHALAMFVLSNSARSPSDELVIAAETRAGELAAELDNELGVAWTHLAAGMRAMQTNDLATSLDLLTQAEQLFLAGSLSHAREATFARVAVLTVCGNYCVDLGYARRHIARVEEEARARGDLFGATWAQLTRSFVALSAGDAAAAREHLSGARSAWPRAFDSMFSATCMIYELGIELHEQPATAATALARIEPEFRQLFTSLIPFPRAMFCRLAGSALVCAWRAGTASHAAVARRIDELVAEVENTPTRSAVVHVLHSFKLAVAGDRAGRIAMLERAAADWEASSQEALAATVRLRSKQLAGDRDAAEALQRQLRELAVGEPHKFAVMIAGPE